MNQISESLIYEKNDIKITNLRAVFGSKTYSIANITSVETQRIEPSGCLVIGLILVGIAFLLIGLVDFTEDWQFIIFGAMLLGLGFLVIKSQKPSFSVALTTASGEIKAYTSTEWESIKEIVEALNNAMIQKG